MVQIGDAPASAGAFLLLEVDVDAGRLEEARLILRALLLGADPETGRPLHRSEVVHRPEVMRALVLALEAISPVQRAPVQGDRQRLQAKSKVPERAGQGWAREEDEELRHLFGQRRTVQAIATELGRTRGAIRSRLVRLGLINERANGPE